MPSPSHNIAEILLSRGAAGAAAVFCGRHALTYDELRRQVGGWAAQLLAAGLCPGARIGLLAENGPFFISAYLGTMLAGSCVVPFPLDCSQAAFADMVRSLGIRRLAVSARFLGRIRPWAEPLGLELLTEEEHGPAGPPPHSIAAAVDPHGLAAIMPTSGSTAEPKGVMVTHGNIAANTEAILRYMALTPADRVMVVLPFSYCYGASLLHTHLLAGASLVLNNRFLFPEKVLDEMDQRHCTGLAGVPSTYQILLRKTNFARRTFPALRWLQQAGGRLPNALIEELRRALPAVRLFIMYGQTEGTARLSYLPPDRLHDKLGSIGRGLPGTRLEVLRPDGTPVCPGSDEVGEIVACGDNVSPGYWNDPEETQRYFRDGKLHTGDMARVDADGFLFIVERGRDFIKAMGNRVSPREVEEVIAELPPVVEAAVLGVPDEILGEAVKAFVVTSRPGALTADAVQAHCTGRLANYKVPKYVEFLASLPKTSSGKVAKEELRRHKPGT